MEKRLEFLEFDKLLESNEPLKERVSEYLITKYKLDDSLKGFKYMVDIISMSLILKKYSRTTIEYLKSYIAYRYDIKAFSVQRQLRYTCTVRGDYLPLEIAETAWWELTNEVEFGLIKVKRKTEI